MRRYQIYQNGIQKLLRYCITFTNNRTHEIDLIKPEDISTSFKEKREKEEYANLHCKIQSAKSRIQEILQFFSPNKYVLKRGRVH